MFTGTALLIALTATMIFSLMEGFRIKNEWGKVGEGDKDGSEEDNSEEGSDKSESDGGDDTSEEDSEDGGDSEEDSEDDTSHMKFVDEKKIPKELMPKYKEMQAKFTRKMQLAARNIKYAEAFQELLRHKGFQEWAKTQDFSGKNTDKQNKKGDNDSQDPTFERFRSYLDEQLQPIKEHFAMSRKQQAEQKDKEDMAQLEKNFPGYKNFEDDAEVILEQYGGHMPKSHAFALAAFPELLKVLEKSKLLDGVFSKKKAGSTNRPTNSNRGNEKKTKSAKTIEEAFAQAEAELQEK